MKAPLRYATTAAVLALAALSPAPSAQPASAAAAQRPVYKDPAQPVERRVEDLLQRMTLDEKVAQMESVWEHKDKIQTATGDFSPAKASAAFPSLPRCLSWFDGTQRNDPRLSGRQGSLQQRLRPDVL